MDRLGLDLGTKHIVLSWREDGRVRSRYEVNGYIELRRDDQFTRQLLVKQGVPHVEHGGSLIAIGGKAEKLAFMFNKTLRRPMAEGGVSRDDPAAQEIMAIIVKSIIESVVGKSPEKGTVLYYCTTAKAVNSESLNVDFHRRIVQLMIEKFVGQERISAFHVNEARCLIMDVQGPAIGISWGAGTITVHAAYMGIPIFEFCVVGAGDLIDLEAARRFGYDPARPEGDYRETPTSVAAVKTSPEFDLGVDHPAGSVGQALRIMYEIQVENIVHSIARGFGDNRDKCRFPEPVTVVNAGGTSMPKGFMVLLSAKLSEHSGELGVPVGEVRQAPEPLLAVSRGCLTAAEMHSDE